MHSADTYNYNYTACKYKFLFNKNLGRSINNYVCV